MQTPNFWLPYAPSSSSTLSIIEINVNQIRFHPQLPLSQVIVTFSDKTPAIEGNQTYDFSGLTLYPSINGQSLRPSSISGDTATFLLPIATFGTISGSETGTAFVDPIEPLAPNVWLMCNFQGLDTGEELRGEPQVHTTMFGTLAAIDMRRKWNLWYSATNPGTIAHVQGVDGEEIRFGNGIAKKLENL